MAEALDGRVVGVASCAERSLGEPGIRDEPDGLWMAGPPGAVPPPAARARASLSSSLGTGELAPAKKMGVEVRSVWHMAG